MNKLVYLYELDSVNTSKEEIEYAQRCMYEEILYHGNQVVLTFNQLTDSKVFLQVLYDKTTFDSIVELFRIGAFKVSCYRQGGEEISTASQYVQLGIEKCLGTSDSFFFSSLPMEATEKDLLMAMSKSLKYSNLKFLREYTQGAIDDETKDRYRFIEDFTELILEISRHEDVYIKSRQSNELCLEECISYIIKSDKRVPSINAEHMILAKSILEGIRKEIEPGNINKRSEWHNRLANDTGCVEDRKGREIAELLVDVSYNYVLEHSINGVSKGTDITGLDGIFPKVEYQYKCWKMNNHIPLKGDTRKVHFQEDVNIPKWLIVLRVLRNITGYNKNKAQYDGKGYGVDFNSELMAWRLTKFAAYTKSIFYILILVALTWGIEWFLSKVELSLNRFGLERLIQVMLLLVFTTIIKNLVQKVVEIKDYSDSFQSVLTTLYDGVRVLFGRKKVGYYYVK